MRTYECIAHSGNTGKQIVIFVRAASASNEHSEALKQDSNSVTAPVLFPL